MKVLKAKRHIALLFRAGRSLLFNFHSRKYENKMKTSTSIIALAVFLLLQPLNAQTAKSERDKSINEARAKNLVERFDSSVIASNEKLQEKIEKNKARKRAVKFCIENSDLKESKKQKLLEALDDTSYSSHLAEFIREHKEGIKEFLKEEGGLTKPGSF